MKKKKPGILGKRENFEEVLKINETRQFSISNFILKKFHGRMFPKRCTLSSFVRHFVRHTLEAPL